MKFQKKNLKFQGCVNHAKTKPLENNNMNIIKIISEHKKIKGKMVRDTYIPPKYPKSGFKRVEAIVEVPGRRSMIKVTRHIDVPK
ncbi:MAG: hypothetical protein [Siphoviridae sp. cttb18]|nr:MAG: hypothetical protein [Siphoviridae sp. cttb18]